MHTLCIIDYEPLVQERPCFNPQFLRGRMREKRFADVAVYVSNLMTDRRITSVHTVATSSVLIRVLATSRSMDNTLNYFLL